MGPTSDAKAGSFSPAYGIYNRAGELYPEDRLPFVRALREKTTVTIDDRTYELPWGPHYFALEPGSHRLEVSYPYLRSSRAGRGRG